MKKSVKKRCLVALTAVGLFCFALIAVVGFTLSDTSAYARVTFSKTYFFLVKECEKTTAVAVTGEIYSSGGAGYYLERENAVALACYYDQSGANSVQKKLEAAGTDTRVLSKSPADLVLRGGACAEREKIEANVQTADSVAHLLYDAANGLERAEISQTQARAALQGATDALSGLLSENTSSHYTRWNDALRQAKRRGAELATGLLFAKDLRYLQTLLCDCIVNVADFFA